jgi:hypothetical protein
LYQISQLGFPAKIKIESVDIITETIAPKPKTQNHDDIGDESYGSLISNIRKIMG